MEIRKIYSVAATHDDALIVDMLLDDEKFTERVKHAYRASDPYTPLTLLITQ